MKKFFLPLIAAALSLQVGAQTVSFSLPAVPCNNDGVLSATFTGFTPPLTVSWTTEGSMGATMTHTVTGSTDALTSYSGGPVSVTVSDGSSITTASYAGAAPFSYTLTATDAVCPTPGSMTAAASGGTSPYTYKWFDMGTGAIVSSANPANLPTGHYGVVITDDAGCVYGSRVHTDTTRVLYTSFTANVSATPAGCTDGTVSVDAVSPSAVSPLSYHWSNGATTAYVSGLTAGTYTVEIRDAVGCRATTDTAAVYNPYAVVVSQTTGIGVSLTSTPAACSSADGSISVTASGGTPPYSYMWSNGGTGSSQTGLGIGLYGVTVTDANGCSGNASTVIGTSSPIAVSTSSSPSLCSSPTGNATAIVSGGTLPYTIKWYSTPAQSGVTATLLPAGTYAYKVTDAMGCVQTGSVTVPSINTLSTSFTATSATCAAADGSIAVSASGGATPYTYLWSNGATTSSVSSVAAGDYTVRVTDAMGCKKTFSYSLASFSPVVVGMAVTPASCALMSDGTIIATPFGGTPPYSYGWSTGSTSSGSITGLAPGYYAVNVTDGAGCTTQASASVDFDPANTDCYCTIEGTVYADANGNCSMESGEWPIPHMQIYCSGIGYTYTDANGHYSFMVPSGSYTITETVVPYYPLSPCQLNNVTVSATASAGCVHNVDFANAFTALHNLRISNATIVPPVPGSKMVQQITIINEGTVQEDSVLLTYNPDGQVFAPTFTPSSLFGGAPYSYQSVMIPPMGPGANMKVNTTYNVPGNIPAGTSVVAGDTVSYNTPSTTWAADNTPSNNVGTLATTVVSSFNPNYKEVSPRGTGANGTISVNDSVLEYTIHFRNTMTNAVQNVVIVDTLDGNLNWTSLHPVYASAPCHVTLKQSGAVKVARFEFSNINLQSETTDDQRCSGMITYEVHTNPGLATGAQIHNKAAIRMDGFSPMTTNTTVNTIGASGPSVVNNPTNETHFATLVVYPNPATNKFYAVVYADEAGTAEMTVTDVSGRTLQAMRLTLDKGTQTVSSDISKLSSGVYFVSVTHNGQKATARLVVSK